LNAPQTLVVTYGGSHLSQVTTLGTTLGTTTATVFIPATLTLILVIVLVLVGLHSLISALIITPTTTA
jgi:hypothetical protein